MVFTKCNDINYLAELSVLTLLKRWLYCLTVASLFFSPLLLLAPYALYAQDQKPTLGFCHLSINDGLSENTVRAIIEDGNGYMWFGSEDGLNRFDGYNFVAYHNDKNETTTLSSRNIKFLFNDSKKNLWILTTNGINIYDPQYDNFCNYRNNKFAALKNLNVDLSGITEDRKGTIWIASIDDGLFKIESLHQASQQLVYPYNDMSKHFLTLLSENDSTLWIGTRDGLLKFNPLSGQYTDCRAQYGKGYDVRQIYKDKEGNMWLCTSQGLKVINQNHELKEYMFNSNNSTGISGNNVISMIPYNDHSYFIAVDGGGLDLFNTLNESFLHYKDELSSKNIVSIYKDTKGDIWVGTYLNGINYSNSTTNLFVLKKNNFLSNNSIKEGIVTRFLKDSKNDLWITTDGGGLYKKRAGQDTYQHYTMGKKGLSSNILISIVEDQQSNIWISSYGGGLLKYIREKDEFKVYTPQFNTEGELYSAYTKALIGFNQDVWISGFGTGIDIYHPATGKFEHLSQDKNNPRAIPSDWVQQFYIDKKGSLWLCTFAGLAKYIPETHDFTTFKFKSTKNTDADINAIVDMTEDQDGNLWLGTLGAGLICFNTNSGVYTCYTTKQGLSNNCIKSIIMDDHSCLWMATNSGVTLFNTITRKAKGYTTKDGLPSCSFYLNSKYKNEEGLLYFGTNNGYLIIDPLLNTTNKKIPPVVITGFKIYNKPVVPDTLNSVLRYSISETKEIVLPYNKNSISFEFSALNYNSSRNNHYAYWLDGFDQKYFYAGTQRTATYTNLDPGTYIFKVKGSNNDGVWNEQGAQIKIVILPPFWMTWWFYTILSLALLCTIYFIHQWRLRNIHHKNILLEEIVQQRTQDLREAHEQLETFVYRASHDIQGPLKSIMGLTILGKKDIRDEAAQTYFKHILTTAKKLDKLLTSLTHLITLRQGNLKKSKIDFRNMIDELLSHFKKNLGYETMNINVEIQDTGEFYSDYNLLSSIAENIIENAIKYADSEKTKHLLNITIKADRENAALSFEDNGDGIPLESQKIIFKLFYKGNVKSGGSGLGLYIVKSAVEQLGGTIALESTPGEGAKFIVLLKALKE
ncbi:MAG: Signal transduction histidine kinase [Chitinophagaceae bacterium]|nr:Signal transduction histidine kinase [Chitinophagaceae bacterium]